MRLLSQRWLQGLLTALSLALVVSAGCGSGRTITSPTTATLTGNTLTGGTTTSSTTGGTTTNSTTGGTTTSSTAGSTNSGSTTGATTTGVSTTGGTTAGSTSTGATTTGGTTTGATTGATTTGSTQPAAINFATQIQPIFDQNCALSGCHASDTASGGMILDAGQSYANIVNVTSSEVAPEKRVAPGDSAHSYLYEKISQAQPRDGGQMPLGSNPLPADTMALIKAWIDQGANK